MATIHPISRYVRSVRDGNPLERIGVRQRPSTYKKFNRIVELPLSGADLARSMNEWLLETLSNTSLNIASLVVAAVRTPPFNLPGISTREFYMSQWRVDANSLMPGVPRLIYCSARIPDSFGIVIACARRRVTPCNNGTDPCKCR